jgi:Tol biopolymer transport system component
MQTGDADVITQAEGGGMRPLVSPDGKLVVYATRYETKTGLRVRNLDTGADRWVKWPVTRDEQESGGSPTRDTFAGYAFMPDGREIVITNNGRIERVNLETGATAPVPFKAKVSLDVGPDLEFP